MNQEVTYTSGTVMSSTPALDATSSTFHQWLFNIALPYCKGKILELGSGDGVISNLFVQNNIPLRLSDPVESSCEWLQHQYRDTPIVKGVHQIDLTNKRFETAYAKFLERFDTLIALNGIGTHFKDAEILANAKTLLRPGGNLVLLTPVNTALYGRSDEEVKGFWSQNRTALKQMLTKAFLLRETRYVLLTNVGAPYVVTPVPAINNIRLKSLTRYDLVISKIQTLDMERARKIGLSVVTIAKKNDLPSVKAQPII